MQCVCLSTRRIIAQGQDTREPVRTRQCPRLNPSVWRGHGRVRHGFTRARDDSVYLHTTVVHQSNAVWRVTTVRVLRVLGRYSYTTRVKKL